MKDTIEVPLSFATDEDGFFRRECPSCLRQFKVWVAPDAMSAYLHEAQSERSPSVRRYCPYCDAVAPPSHWWSREQLAYMRRGVTGAAKDLVAAELAKAFGGSGRRGGLTFKNTYRPSGRPGPLRDPNDMRVVEVPSGRLKVLESWNGPVRDHFGG